MAERPLHISAFDDPPDIRRDSKSVVDAGDPSTLKAAVKEAKSAEQVKNETVRNLMTVEANRKYFYNVLDRCYIYTTPFSDRRERTDFNCGQQNIGLSILADLQVAAPDLYLLMLEENRNAT